MQRQAPAVRRVNWYCPEHAGLRVRLLRQDGVYCSLYQARSALLLRHCVAALDCRHVGDLAVLLLLLLLLLLHFETCLATAMVTLHCCVQTKALCCAAQACVEPHNAAWWAWLLV
jgi:hypothetical protein